MAEKRRGLGRGIAALIPPGQEENKNRPIDVFFNSPRPADKSDGAIKDAIVEDKASKAAKATEANEANKPTEAATHNEATKPSESVKSKKRTTAKTSDGDKKAAKTSKVSEVSSDEQREVTSGYIYDTDTSEDELVPVPGATFGEIPVEHIVPNTKQPRQVFDEDDLAELTASIREVGILQPIVVRPLTAPVEENPEARYELIMGERRWRASTAAGRETVPAIVRHTEEVDLLRDALLENLHRTQLNALEEAAAYQQLLEDFNCTQEELSRRIARSRPQISNTLRLLKLPPLVQRRVAAGVISAGHARALLGLTDPAAMERLAQRIVAEGLSVRSVEEIVAIGEDSTDAPRAKRSRVSQYATELNEVANRLGGKFDTRVKVNMGLRKGKISIDFATIEDLNRILAVLNEEQVDIAESPNGK